MDSNWKAEIHVPDDLDEAIRQGICDGKAVLARRGRAKRLAVRSVCSLVLVLGLFVGGINLSPAFAAAVSDIPFLGQLVQVFGKNELLVQGGSQAGDSPAALTMERSGDMEGMRLEFQQEDASLYQVEFSSYPKTITITLPGTKGVEILSEISRAQDTSQYIKSVYQMPTSTRETAILQLELESDADVQIQEYRDPGSLVIQLTPADIQLDTVYSVRTLSFDEEGLRECAAQYAARSTRVLRDDNGMYFLEFAQYASSEQAEEAQSAIQGDVIVEKRTGNNVPVCFASVEAYETDRFLNEYYELLLNSTTAEPVLDFMEQHFAQSNEEEQDTMLRGLSGLLQDYEEEVDWERAASFYQLAGQELPDFLREAIETERNGNQ